jgi:hypothetical protein
MNKETVYYDKMSVENFALEMKGRLSKGAIVTHSDIHYTCNPARHTEFKVFGIVTFETPETPVQ